MTELIDDLPPRECVHSEGGWRIAHAFDTSLPGWLVLVPTRHVTALDELTTVESEELGLLVRRASIALKAVTGCERTYVMHFAEQEGFSHLHVHLVPRMAWFTAEQVGPRVFAFLGGPQAEWLPEDDRDALALRLRTAMATTR
jgi:diadenosine tetraphosphate (Ap4A) HIT family hydrolase